MIGHGQPHRMNHWTRGMAIFALVAGPVLLYQFLPLAGVSAAATASVAAIITVKHLGLFAVLLSPLYALLRRRSRR